MDVNAGRGDFKSGFRLEGLKVFKGGEMRHLVGYNQGFRVSLELVINIQVLPTSHKKPKVCSVPPFPLVLISNFNLDEF